MKVVSVMTTSSAGGAEFAAIEMLDALAERGHETVILSDLDGISRGTRVTMVRISLGEKLSRRSWRQLTLAWPMYVARLRRALDSQRPYDVLLVHYKKEQLMVPWLPPRLRRRVWWAEWGPVPFPLRRGVPRLAYLFSARGAEVVMAISAGTKRSVQAVGVPAAKVRVVPNVVDVDSIRYRPEGRAAVRQRLDIPPDAFVVGCISRFHPKKRNDVVIEGVLGLEDPRIHLIMAGAGETESELRELAAPLDERAHFVPTPTNDVADVLSAFDVSVFCPSPTEGEPRATILGMLAERPCLATGPEGVIDLIRPEFGAITQPENDPAALTALLRTYVADPALGASQGRAARAWAEGQFARLVVAEQIERILAGG
jgi:glycosyltransferase involved in cell wall biosynthesis